MSAPNRLLSILSLFEDGPPVWTVEAIAEQLHMPTSTTYRHVRELVQFGFLDPVRGAGYALGPAFIRYDRISRQYDQIIKSAAPEMRDLLVRTSQKATVILCRRFKDCVMCIHQEHGAEPHAATSYERGVAMPMFLGATSKVILANLSDRALRAIYERNDKLICQALRVQNWDQFKSFVRTIRQAGHVVTDSEVAAERVGIAAPISRDGSVIAGISLVIASRETRGRRLDAFVLAVKAAAARINESLDAIDVIASR